MIPDGEKTVLILPPILVNGGDAVTTLLDTKGFNYARIDLHIGAIAANISALRLTQSDTGNTSNNTLTGTVSNVTGSLFGTSTNIDGSTSALPTTDNGNTIFSWEVDLRGCKRYLKPVCTVGSGNDLLSIAAKLRRAEESPESMSERGANQTLRIPSL